MQNNSKLGLFILANHHPLPRDHKPASPHQVLPAHLPPLHHPLPHPSL